MRRPANAHGEPDRRVLYRAVLLYTFGKTQASFERSRAVTRKINGFLGRPLQTRYEWVEEVWWWFFSP